MNVALVLIPVDSLPRQKDWIAMLQVPLFRIAAEPFERGEAPRLRLDTLIKLRWLAIAGQSLCFLFVEFVLGFPTPLTAAAAVILGATLLNLVLGLRYPVNSRLNSRTSAFILSFDILQLSALLYLTGGLENPFSFLFLAPVLISAAALPPRTTIALGALAVISATCLSAFHEPLPWVEGQTLIIPRIYVGGIWVSIMLGLVFIGMYAWRVAEEARLLAQALAATELVLAREQHLVAVDGLAAAAAHQLGTPLSTIAVVVKELDRQFPAGHPIKDDLTLLREEANRCREILAKIASLGGETEGPLGALSVAHLLEELVAPHRNFGVEITVDIRGAGPEPVTARNPGLIYGIGNLIENAVDFAENHVIVMAQWSGTEVSVTISDDGPGIAPDVIDRLGEPYLTTRQTGRQEKRGEGGGLGLGLFIAKTLLERSGALITWGNVPGASGARVFVVWPRVRFDRRTMTVGQTASLP